MNNFWKTKEIPVMILSYPKSGSNFLNYCIKQLYGKDLWKNHAQSPEFWNNGPWPIEDADWPLNMILILRNYKECILSGANKKDFKFIKSHLLGERTTLGKKHVFDYITILKYYDELQKDKMLIYYEDLITDPHKELQRVILFLKKYQMKTDKFESFINNISDHRQKSLQGYRGNITDGNTLIQHSNGMRSEDRIKTDNYLLEKYPELWNKYLKRYKS